MRRWQKQQGMTLLELLIATTVLAIMTGIGFIGIHTMTTAATRIAEQETVLQKKNLLMIQVVRDVNAAISSQSLSSVQKDFSGGTQRFELTRFEQSLQPANAADLGDVIQVAWYLRNGVLYRAQRPVVQQHNNQAWQQQAMMDVQSWLCEYLSYSGQWQPTWPSQTAQNSQLPRQIKCRLTDENGALSEWLLTPWQET